MWRASYHQLSHLWDMWGPTLLRVCGNRLPGRYIPLHVCIDCTTCGAHPCSEYVEIDCQVDIYPYIVCLRSFWQRCLDVCLVVWLCDTCQHRCWLANKMAAQWITLCGQCVSVVMDYVDMISMHSLWLCWHDYMTRRTLTVNFLETFHWF